MIFVIKVYIDWLKKPFITEKYDFFTYLKIQRDVKCKLTELKTT